MKTIATLLLCIMLVECSKPRTAYEAETLVHCKRCPGLCITYVDIAGNESDCEPPPTASRPPSAVGFIPYMAEWPWHGPKLPIPEELSTGAKD